METQKSLFLHRLIVIILVLVFNVNPLNAQFCDSLTPTFNVDLTAAPNMSWVSPIIARNGSCCGSTNPDKCLEFVITLHPASAAIVFNFASGAVPPGALFYQIDCGPVTPVGSPICLTGVGPFHLTFCKPGNNSNTFSIETIPNPIFGPNLTLGDGCSDDLTVQFYDESSITWNSISPGAIGAYNSYLSCSTGCDTTNVQATGLPPSTVNYLVCGTALNGCVFEPICDTMTVQFMAPPIISIQTPDSILCFNESSTILNTVVSGGSGGFTYLWSNGSTASTISIGPGNYSVTVLDNGACNVYSDNITITQLPPPDVAAGPNQNLCDNYIGSISLSGTASNTSGIVWIGNGGTFSPDSVSLTTTYTPTPTEIALGIIDIILQSNDSSGCPSVLDATAIQYVSTAQSVNISTQDVSCFGNSNGTAFVIATGPQAPFTYSFDGGPYSSNNATGNLAPGTHSVSILSSIGCDSVIEFQINEPPLLQLQLSQLQNVLCNGLSTGSATVNATGGYGIHHYSWNTTPSQSSSQVINLSAGSYTATVQDDNGCIASLPITISEPAPLSLQFDVVPPSCFGFNNGAISSIVNGGVSPYTYSWNNGSVGTSIYSVAQGNYSLVVTDSNGCQISQTQLVNQPPALIISGSNDTTVCSNSQVSLTVNAQGGTGTYTYSWTPANNNSNQATFTVINDQTFSCIVQDNNGCSAMDQIMVSTFVLNPNDVIALSQDSVICINDSTIITGQYLGNDPTVTLSWNHCSNCSSSTTVSPISTSTYTIVATNQCGQQISDNVTVAVSLPPVVQLNVEPIEVCPGEYFIVHNLGTNDTTYNYTWTFSDGYVSHDMNAVHSIPSSGNFSVGLSITNSFGCTSDSSSLQAIIVHPNAIADFTPNTFEQTTLYPTFMFNNQSVDASIFEWHFGDGTTSNLYNVEHTYAEYGDFTITLNANNQYNCPGQTQLVVTVKPSFELYVPNAFTPDGDKFNNVFKVEGYGIIEEGFTMEIYNRWGEMIFYSTDINGGWDGTYKGENNIVQDGVYTWKVRFKDITYATHEKHGHVSLLR